jgi:hypothetical protein
VSAACERCDFGGPVPVRSAALRHYVARLYARRTAAIQFSRDVCRLTRSTAWARLQRRVQVADGVLHPVPRCLIASWRLHEVRAHSVAAFRCPVHGVSA